MGLRNQNRPKRPPANKGTKRRSGPPTTRNLARKSEAHPLHRPRYLPAGSETEREQPNEAQDNSVHWPVLKRPLVAGFEAPDDKRDSGAPTTYAYDAAN